MLEIYYCIYCEWVDYLNTKVDRCPKCGSPTKYGNPPFTDESIRVEVTTTDLKKNTMLVTFSDLDKIVDNILLSTFSKILSDINNKRVIFLIKAYVWVLLKRSPQLWLEIDHVVRSLAELIFVRLSNL